MTLPQMLLGQVAFVRHCQRAWVYRRVWTKPLSGTAAGDNVRAAAAGPRQGPYLGPCCHLTRRCCILGRCTPQRWSMPAARCSTETACCRACKPEPPRQPHTHAHTNARTNAHTHTWFVAGRLDKGSARARAVFALRLRRADAGVDPRRAACKEPESFQSRDIPTDLYVVAMLVNTLNNRDILFVE